MNIKERLYCFFTDIEAEPTKLGSDQFWALDSKGIKPEVPDPYFHRLMDGKKWFHLQQTTIKDTYGTFDWLGWYCHWLDFRENPWILPFLFSWANPPAWFYTDKPGTLTLLEL